MSTRAFAQVDVFSTAPFGGNPVAVVLAADGMTDEEMAAFARWTNLSETTFVLPPTDAAADYRLRIFTPGGELPFAGHPTLGSAHAWLEAGGAPRGAVVVQECGAGLVRVRQDAGRVAFAAPPLRRSGPATPDEAARVVAFLGVDAGRVRSVEWVDNGPGWVAALLDSADTVLSLRPDMALGRGMVVGAVGPYPVGAEAAVEVRAFCPDLAIDEDPVTGSLNAGLAQWLLAEGVLQAPYVAAQGTALGRTGRVHIEVAGGETWVGGACVTRIRGTVDA